MQKKLLESLKKADLPLYEREYIISVVYYIDKRMQEIDEANVSVSVLVSKMMDICKQISNGLTGIPEIDEICLLRKKAAYEQIGEAGRQYIESHSFDTHSHAPYVENYISLISQYGGLYKYTCENYVAEISKSESTHKSPIK